jgi:ectoine hydroxylase-related dioxygenase (phytanoyl-CoA dioxygenase family)
MNLGRIDSTYHQDGFAIVREVFSSAEVAAIRRHIEEFMRDVAPTFGPGDIYYEDTPERPIKSMFLLHKHSDFFRDLMGDRRLVEILRCVWPEGEILSEGVMFFGKPARDGSLTPMHQDNAFQCWDPPLALTATIAVDRSTPENGALTCLRGSHALGLLPHHQSGVLGFSRCLSQPGEVAAYPEVQLCLQPGDVALHGVNTVHGSGPNTTDRSRWQLGLSYRNSLARRDEQAYARYRADLEALHQDAAAK